MRDSICRNTSASTSGIAAGTSIGTGTTDSVTMRNTTLYSNGGPAVSLAAIGTGSASWDLKNVIAFAGGVAADVQAAADPTATASVALAYSNFDARSQTGSGTVTDPTTNNNQTTPPQFVNAAAGNFHQLRTSPTVDAGVIDSLGSADIDGQLRVYDDGCNGSNLPDIGADELNRPCNDDFAQAQVLSGSTPQASGTHHRRLGGGRAGVLHGGPRAATAQPSRIRSGTAGRHPGRARDG